LTGAIASRLGAAGEIVMALNEALLDRIYEAAAIPEHWPDVLEKLAAIAGAQAGALVAYRGREPAGHTSSSLYREGYEDYLTNGSGIENVRPLRHLERQYPGFLSDLDVQSAEELERDEIYRRFLHPHGLQWTAGTLILSPSNDLLLVDVARAAGEAPFDRQSLEALDAYRPHIARASLLSARLGLRAATDMTDAMQLLGLPAIALGSAGKVVAVNSLVDGLGERIVSRSFERVGLTHPAADALLAAALTDASSGTTRSIPLPASEDQPALILHLLPVSRAAHDIFAAAKTLLLITDVTAPEAPTQELLAGLFDLTPAEARVARALASGLPLDRVAADFGLSVQTIRNQLAAVFHKTGTSRQVELLRLIAGSAPLRRPRK
jgi:DNA-binding CsgD family transcriptional regulator